MLDYRIETFLEVCKYLNYSKAAKSLHITQPAVSQHIKYLEEQYNIPLFNHIGRQVVLTDAGKTLYQKAMMLQNDANYLQNQLQHMDTHQQETHFGVTKTIGEYVIGTSLAKYVKNHPHTHFKVEMANTSELLESMKNGTIQFALIEGNYPKDEYESIVFKEEDFICVCSSNYPMEKKAIRMKDLLKNRLLVRESGSGTREILEQNLIAHNMHIDQFEDCFEIQSVHLIVEFLKQNVGISFLYRSAIQKELNDGILQEIDIQDFQIKHDYVFLWMKDSLFTEEYKTICKELMENL